MQAPQGDPMQQPPQQAPQGPQGAQPLPGEDVDVSGDDQGSEEEVMRGIEGISNAIYGDADMSDKILAMVDGEEKVGSTAKAVIMLVTEMDKKIDLDEEAIAAVSVFAADRLMELVEADARKDLEYSDMEAKQVIMTTMEGIFTAYGVTPERGAQVAEQVGPEQTAASQKIYEETLNG